MLQLPPGLDSNVASVVKQYVQRAEHGKKKYGVTTERTDIDLRGWLQHLKEELMDATIYIERTLVELDYDAQAAKTTKAGEAPQAQG